LDGEIVVRQKPNLTAPNAGLNSKRETGQSGGRRKKREDKSGGVSNGGAERGAAVKAETKKRREEVAKTLHKGACKFKQKERGGKGKAQKG